MSGKFRVSILFVVIGLLSAASVFAQNNSISGGVYGINRTPIADIHIELLDEYGGSVQRSRTNGAGRYRFHGMPAGNYNIRVMPYGTDYDEQELPVQLRNFTRATDGGTSTSSVHEVLDFYLRVRKGVDPTMVGVVFAQEIPGEAKKNYEKALGELADKKDKEAYESLKKAIEVFPKYFLALDRLGKEYREAGHYEASAILLEMAVDVNAKSFTTWHALAYSYYQLKKYDEATNAIDKALTLNTGTPEALLLAGLLLKHNKKYDEAEKQLLKARELSKDRIPVIHRELAMLYANELKRYPEAIRELRAYMKADKNANQEQINKIIASLEAKVQGS